MRRRDSAASMSARDAGTSRDTLSCRTSVRTPPAPSVSTKPLPDRANTPTSSSTPAPETISSTRNSWAPWPQQRPDGDATSPRFRPRRRRSDLCARPTALSTTGKPSRAAASAAACGSLAISPCGHLHPKARKARLGLRFGPKDRALTVRHATTGAGHGALLPQPCGRLDRRKPSSTPQSGTIPRPPASPPHPPASSRAASPGSPWVDRSRPSCRTRRRSPGPTPRRRSDRAGEIGHHNAHGQVALHHRGEGVRDGGAVAPDEGVVVQRIGQRDVTAKRGRAARVCAWSKGGNVTSMPTAASAISPASPPEQDIDAIR
jgi:hypothetical protein